MFNGASPPMTLLSAKTQFKIRRVNGPLRRPNIRPPYRGFAERLEVDLHDVGDLLPADDVIKLFSVVTYAPDNK
jgi:hypothetical protein